MHKEPITLTADQKRFCECKDRLVFWSVEPVFQTEEETTQTQVLVESDGHGNNIWETVPVKKEVIRETYSRIGLTTACVYLCAQEMMQGRNVVVSVASKRQARSFKSAVHQMCKKMEHGQPMIFTRVRENYLSIQNRGTLNVVAFSRGTLRGFGSYGTDMYIFDMIEYESSGEYTMLLSAFSMSALPPKIRFRVVGRSLPPKWCNLGGTFFVS